jgi:hypothetical protein
MIVSELDILTESTLPIQDTNFNYPLGLNKFKLLCTSTGAVGIVTIYYDRIYDTTQWQWKKFASSTNTYTNI